MALLGQRAMDELRESSLLFSLEGLLETERERVQREAREAQKRRDEEMVRVAEQASRRRLAAEQERASRERRAVLEQERERLEQERIDAMKRAAIERARIETEAKVRLVELEQARKHELLMSQLREAQRTTRYRVLTWLSSSAFALSVAAALGIYFGYIAPAQAAQKRQLEAIIDANAEKAKATARALDAEQRKSETLSRRLQQLEAQANSTPADVASPTNAPSHSGVGKGPIKGATHGTTPVPRNCPDDGDPLRGCLGRPR
jgi:hypothetical protein